MSPKNNNWFSLFSSNYVGVLNDNFLKHCIVFIGVTWAMPNYLSQSGLIALVSAALIVPYLFLSPLGGRLAVRYSKQKIFRLCKLAEFPIMLLATVGFYFQSVTLCLIAVLLMGVQSCLYSPAKYGLIRDIGGEQGLSFGNGVFETMAFLGILSGTVFASLISDHYTLRWVTALFFGFALLGYLATVRIRVIEVEIVEKAHTSLNPIKFLKESYLFAKQYPLVNMGVLGVSIFWLIGGVIQMNLVIHCTQTLHTNNTTAGIVIFNPPVLICAVLIFLTAFMGGLFEVPCLALVQQADTGRKLGNLLAYMNLVIFIFVLLGAGIFAITTQLFYDNSLVVFGVIVGICLTTLIYFSAKFCDIRVSVLKKYSAQRHKEH